MELRTGGLGANIFKMTNVPSSRYQKSDMTIGFCDIDLVGKSCWMSQKSSFFAIFSMTKIENWGHFGKMWGPPGTPDSITVYFS